MNKNQKNDEQQEFETASGAGASGGPLRNRSAFRKSKNRRQGSQRKVQRSRRKVGVAGGIHLRGNKRANR